MERVTSNRIDSKNNESNIEYRKEGDGNKIRRYIFVSDIYLRKTNFPGYSKFIIRTTSGIDVNLVNIAFLNRSLSMCNLFDLFLSSR